MDACVDPSRAESVAWYVKLVGRHKNDWLAELREAMTAVADAPGQGPSA